MSSNDTFNPVGNFSGPATNAPRRRADEDLQRNDADASGADDVQKIADEVNAQLKPLTPEEKATKYLEGLDVVGLTQEEARDIMDQVLFGGGYEKEYKISAKMFVVFRSRTGVDTQRMLRLVEAEAPRMPMHVDDIIGRVNIAASLRRYGKQEFHM